MTLETPNLSHLLPALITALPSAVLIIIAAVVLNVVASRGLLLIARRTHLSPQEIKPLRRAMRWVITIVALVLVFGAFGLNVGGMWGVLSTVLAMVAIGFVAVWSVLSNTLCTLIIIAFRPFAVGDDIEFAGEPVKGRVIDLNFIYTSLDAGDGMVVQIPNNLFFQKVLRRRQAATAVSAAAHLRAKRADAPEALPAPMRVPGN